MSGQSGDGRLLSFDVGDDEKLIVGAISRHGDRRTIYEGAEPDEYALIPTDDLVRDEWSMQEISVSELRVEDLRLLGPSVYVGSDDDTSVGLRVNGDTRVNQGAPGVYGLLWIPLADS